MTRSRLLWLAALVFAAGAWYLALPARTTQLSNEALVKAPVVRGAFHVHSRRSDGTGTVQAIAAAAGRAGLSFVVLTDHGDGSGTPAPPAYYDGVLVIDGVEINTDGGHVVALGMRESAYPLAGDPRDVVEDIARLHGVSIAAHPTSSRPSLRWTDWQAPIDGLEWLNGDSEWRDEGWSRLAGAIFTYPFRPHETLARLVDRPDEVIRRWDQLAGTRPVVALAGADAHARMGLRGEGQENSTSNALSMPSYEESFRVFSIGIPRLPISGEASSDGEAVIGALLQGNVFSSLDALARPASLAFTASTSGVRAGMGDRLPVGAAVEFSAVTNAPGNATVTLLKDGAALTSAQGPALQFSAPPGPGVYRVEVSLPGAPGSPPVPWIVSNPIYVRPPIPAVRAPPRPPVSRRVVRYSTGPATGWTIEKSARALGALDVRNTVEGTELALRYALGGSTAEAPFVALTMPAGSISGYDRLSFTSRAIGPMRLSVQVRAPGGPDGQRWHRSVYIDETSHEVTVAFSDLKPRGETAQPTPPLGDVQHVLFVIDSVNTKPGSSGELWIDNVAYETSEALPRTVERAGPR